MLNPFDDRNQFDIKLTKTEEALRERQISEEKLRNELHILEEKYSLLKQISTNHGLTTDQFEKKFHDLLNKNKNLSGQVHLRRENERLKTELENLKIQQTSKPAKCKYDHIH
jgi:septal ring factor EnvC (AmiA/AmiB activator)